MRKSSARKAKQKRLILLSNYAFCGMKKKKKRFSLRINNSTVLIIFEITTLKLIT